MKDALASALASQVAKRKNLLAKHIQQLPPMASRPLTVSGRVAGWITSKATVHAAGLPGIHVEDEAVHITACIQQRLSLPQVFERLATVLRDTGCLRGWRDELLDVFGEGRRLSVIERAAVRPLGLLTKAVHLNAWSPDGELWVARRSPTKSTDPGMWDTLVGGLAGAGENLDTSLLRESNEEAGLEPEDIQARSPLRTILRMHRRLPEGYQVEDVLVSDVVLDRAVQPQNRDGEVSEIKLVSLDDLWSMVEAGEFTREAELVILEGLERRMQQGLVP
jgi:isopentenyldiphosphate isomerase